MDKTEEEIVGFTTKDKLIFLLTIFITIGIFVFVEFSIQPYKKFENREIFKIVKNEGLSSQSISQASRYSDKLDYKIPKPYTGECEKELVNKYSTNQDSVLCTGAFLKDITTAKTYGNLYNKRDNLLDCYERLDKNLYDAYRYNVMGIDIIMLDAITYSLQCQENKELIETSLLRVSFLFIFLFSFIFYVLTNKPSILFIGTFIGFIAMICTLCVQAFLM